MCNNDIIIPAEISPRTSIVIGIWDTLNVRSQTFDISGWVSDFGPGQLLVIHQRATDELPYQVANVTVDNGVATWTFDETDSAIVGTGAAALVYVVGDEYIARTPGIPTFTGATIGMSGAEPHDPWESWYTHILEASAAAQQSAEDAAASETAAAESERNAAASETAAASSERNAAASETAAAASERAAAESAADAQTALEGMVYVTFYIDDDGHVIIRNGDLLGTTSFELISVTGAPAGHLEVSL